MKEKIPVLCPKCGAVVVEDEKNLQFFVVIKDIKCPKCKHIIIRANNGITWGGA